MRPSRQPSIVRRSAALVLGVLTIAGCSSSSVGSAAKSSTSSGSASTASAVTASATTSAPDPQKITSLDQAKASFTRGGIISQPQAQCLVDALVKAVGTDGTLALMNSLDLSGAATPAQDAIVAAFETCVPKSSFSQSLDKQIQQSARLARVSVSGTQSSCAADKIMGAVTVRDLIIEVQGADFSRISPDKQQAILDAMRSCLGADLALQLNWPQGVKGSQR